MKRKRRLLLCKPPGKGISTYLAKELLVSIKTSPFGIKRIIKELNPKKSEHDDIIQKMLIELRNIATAELFLLSLQNNSQLGYYLSSWRKLQLIDHDHDRHYDK